MKYHLIGLLTMLSGMIGNAELTPEKLGVPVRQLALGIGCVSPTEDGSYWAWGMRKRNAVVGFDIRDGRRTEIDITRYRASNIQYTVAVDGSLIIYAGNPGRFLRRHLDGRVEELGIPEKAATYWMQQAIGPDGMFYVGTYPRKTLVGCDLNSFEVKNFGTMGEDERQKYITSVAADADGWLYSAVGLHHAELWAFNPQTAEKRQILPATITEKQGAPKVWTGKDGKVYGRFGKYSFLCLPDKIEIGKTQPAQFYSLDKTTLSKHKDGTLRGQFKRTGADEYKLAGKEQIIKVDDKGLLQISANGKKRQVQVDWPGYTPNIYSVATERNGKIYGGTVFPGIAWSYDPQSNAFTEFPGAAPKVIQIYDIYNHEKGLFFASYMGCHLDFFNPEAPHEKGVNPKRFKGSIRGHERPNQWCGGPDGKLYFGTTPAKGRLGGALVSVDPETFACNVRNQLIQDQSITYLTPIPNTTLLYGCCSISGGSSAIPSEKEAKTFLWDTQTERLVWQGKPIPGTKTYHRAVATSNGLVGGLADHDTVYVFDPQRRQTVWQQKTGLKGFRFPGLADNPVGKEELLIGISSDAVFCLDTEKREFRILGNHESLRRAHGFMVTREEILYYGTENELWRCPLNLSR